MYRLHLGPHGSCYRVWGHVSMSHWLSSCIRVLIGRCNYNSVPSYSNKPQSLRVQLILLPFFYHSFHLILNLWWLLSQFSFVLACRLRYDILDLINTRFHLPCLLPLSCLVHLIILETMRTMQKQCTVLLELASISK